MEVTRKDISEKVEIISLLLEKIKYTKATVELTDEEKRKLYNFIVKYTQSDNNKTDISNPQTLDELNNQLFTKMTDDIKEIILKCGLNPTKVYVSNDKGIDLDEGLYNALNDFSYSKVDLYTIERRNNYYMIDNANDDEDDICYYRVLYNSFDFNIHDMVPREIYRYEKSFILGDRAYFRDIQLYGAMNLNDYRFSAKSGMMYVDEKIAENISEIMIFLNGFENRLKKEISKNKTRKKEFKMVKEDIDLPID